MADQKSNTIRKCSAEGCESNAAKRGFCDKHYRRIQRRGTLQLIRQPPGQLVNAGKYCTITIDGKKIPYHVYIAEKAIGKKLPTGAEVHHVNNNGRDNRNSNLVICQNRDYHALLHARERAFDESGNASWRKCSFCKKYDDLKNMSSYLQANNKTYSFYHKACATLNVRLRKKENRERISVKTTG
jgi:hypothetical protein